MSLRERKWMGLSGFENEFCVTFLKNLGVIVSGLGSKVCEWFDWCNKLKKN